jgi:hypothetical protein
LLNARPLQASQTLPEHSAGKMQNLLTVFHEPKIRELIALAESIKK